MRFERTFSSLPFSSRWKKKREKRPTSGTKTPFRIPFAFRYARLILSSPPWNEFVHTTAVAKCKVFKPISRQQRCIHLIEYKNQPWFMFQMIYRCISCIHINAYIFFYVNRWGLIYRTITGEKGDEQNYILIMYLSRHTRVCRYFCVTFTVCMFLKMFVTQNHRRNFLTVYCPM